MIIGYLCECCKGCADRVTQAKYEKDGVSVRLGYFCEDCQDQVYKQYHDKRFIFKDWTFSWDFTDIKSVDLMAIYEKKEEKLHKKF